MIRRLATEIFFCLFLVKKKINNLKDCNENTI